MKKLLIVGGILFGLLIGILLFVSYKSSFQQVKIELGSGNSANIYTGAYGGDGHTQNQLGKKIRTVSNNEVFKLKKGAYTALLNDDKKQYDTTYFALNVGDQPVTLTVHPNYSIQTLDNLLAGEEPAIKQVLQSKYPQVGKTFSVSAGKLYQRGEWYATLLKPSDPSQDTYRVVLQKKDNVWQIVTDPPEIVLSKVRFPTIPGDVVSGVDNFQR